MDNPNSKQESHRPSSRLERVDQACDEYGRQWNAGASPKIESFIANAIANDRRLLLRHLLALDLSLRSESGEVFDPEDYKSRFVNEVDLIDSVIGNFLNREQKADACKDRSPTGKSTGAETTCEEVPSAIGRNDRHKIIQLYA
ncbi:MAG: hypothetical protein AAF483_22030 [Planctomycetota bacterium]